jgi:hypothetical protein
MKKIYFSVVAILTVMTIHGQQTIGFEGVNLSPESYNNGESGAGGFIEEGVVFGNTYTIGSWGDYWSGFAVSNTTDVSTAGYLNQYSAFPGEGANSSSNYGVCYSNGLIQFAGQGVDLVSLQLTNTTYAGLAMLDGDTYSKQFGSVNDANGTPDGTNGEDFFKVWIYAHAEDNSIIDSVDFYLADYRFADSDSDYIVNTWETVDLSFIDETVYALSFGFQSSDNGAWGMNTPAYFAIDNLIISKSIGVKEHNMPVVSMFPNPAVNNFQVIGSKGILEVFDVSGSLVFSGNHLNKSVVDISGWNNGSYRVILRNENGVVVQHLIK